jgi:hypothetical protein
MSARRLAHQVIIVLAILEATPRFRSNVQKALSTGTTVQFLKPRAHLAKQVLRAHCLVLWLQANHALPGISAQLAASCRQTVLAPLVHTRLQQTLEVKTNAQNALVGLSAARGLMGSLF